jgi:bla regulator protein blaR1
MDQRFGDKLVQIPGTRRRELSRYVRFSSLTTEQKRHVTYIGPEPAKTPSEAEFNRWKNPRQFGIWLDGKRSRNFANTRLTASDIAAYSGSYVYKNARQPEGYLYQMELMTHARYAAYLKEQEQSPFLFLDSNRPAVR